MSYLSQIVHDARPRRAAAPLSAVGEARSTEGLLVDARLLPSRPMAQRPGVSSDISGVAADPTQRPPAHSLPPDEEVVGIDPEPPLTPVPTANGRAGAVDLGAGDNRSDTVTATDPTGTDALRPLDAGTGQTGSAAPQRDKPGGALSMKSNRRDTPARTGDGEMQAEPVQKELHGTAPSRHETEVDLQQDPVPVAAAKWAGRPADANDPGVPPSDVPALLSQQAAAEPRPLSERPMPRDPTPAAPSDRAVTEVRIGHLQIDIADVPQPPRPAPPTSARARPSPARFHVRRL